MLSRATPSIFKSTDCLMETTDNAPDWFTVGAPLMWDVICVAADVAKSFRCQDLNLASLPSAAIWFMADALNIGVEANRKGKHAHAMLLNRCCLESLTVAELGLLKGQQGLSLLRDWHEGKKSQGELRKGLSQGAWKGYGTGIFGESWADFMSELFKSVQSYAHYTPDLMNWQMAVVHEVPASSKDGAIYLLMKLGPETYDKEKATSVTLYQCVVAWAVGRILSENGHVDTLMLSRVEKLGVALAKEPMLANRKNDWSFIFWPHTFAAPSAEEY